MKKLLLLSIFVVGFLNNSCSKDDSLDPRPVFINGDFVRLDITRSRLDVTNLNSTSFGGMLTAPSGKVAKYNLYVRKTNIYGFTYDDFKLVKSITNFPTDLIITPSDLSTALNVPVTSFALGEVLRFYGESFDNEGKLTNFYSLSSPVQTVTAYKQAYRFGSDFTDAAGVSPANLRNFPSYDVQ